MLQSPKSPFKIADQYFIKVMLINNNSSGYVCYFVNTFHILLHHLTMTKKNSCEMWNIQISM